MIRRLIILLLIVGCEKDTTSPKPEDCAGVAGGNAYLDECGFCVLYGTHTDHVCPECGDGYVLLWGGCYTVEGTTNLSLWGNQLTGEIPSEIGNLMNLTSLNLGGNDLTGEIPTEIGNLTNLTDLRLYDNQLTGDIPQQVCDLIESNNLNLTYDILSGNENLINTCE